MLDGSLFWFYLIILIILNHSEELHHIQISCNKTTFKCLLDKNIQRKTTDNSWIKLYRRITVVRSFATSATRLFALLWTSRMSPLISDMFQLSHVSLLSNLILLSWRRKYCTAVLSVSLTHFCTTPSLFLYIYIIFFFFWCSFRSIRRRGC